MNERISGVILAGGRGRRMGGLDKGLQIFRGRPLAAWAAERLAAQVDELFINANRNADDYARLGYPVVGDLVPDFAGPLAGLHAALTHASNPLLATAPCDSPFLPADLVVRLQQALVATDASIAVARTGDQPHPVFCLCRRNLLPELTASLERGERRFEGWYRSTHSVEVSFDDQTEAFSNINTRRELDAFQ